MSLISSSSLLPSELPSVSHGPSIKQLQQSQSQSQSQAQSDHSPSTYSKLLLTEITRCLHKSAEAFKDHKNDNGLSPHFDDLSGELLSSWISEKLADKLAIAEPATVESTASHVD